MSTIDEAPFLVHVAGPDDLLPAGSWSEAVTIAHGINDSIADYAAVANPETVVWSWASPYSREQAQNAGVI